MGIVHPRADGSVGRRRDGGQPGRGVSIARPAQPYRRDLPGAARLGRFLALVRFLGILGVLALRALRFLPVDLYCLGSLAL